MHDIRVWMLIRKLKPNECKAEISLARVNLRSLYETMFGSLILGDVSLCPGACAINLEVIFDLNLNFKYHINSLLKICNYHIFFYCMQ